VKNNALHSVLSIVLTITILLPFTIQMVHTLDSHEHIVCYAKEVKHIDQHQVDCGDYHQIIEQNSINFLLEINLNESLTFTQIPSYYYQSQYGIQLYQKSSRAPPYFII